VELDRQGADDRRHPLPGDGLRRGDGVVSGSAGDVEHAILVEPGRRLGCDTAVRANQKRADASCQAGEVAGAAAVVVVDQRAVLLQDDDITTWADSERLHAGNQAGEVAGAAAVVVVGELTALIEYQDIAAWGDGK